jgi:hypothetical protein
MRKVIVMGYACLNFASMNIETEYKVEVGTLIWLLRKRWQKLRRV